LRIIEASFAAPHEHQMALPLNLGWYHLFGARSMKPVFFCLSPLLMCVAMLSGCGGSGSLVDGALQAGGLRKPAPSEASQLAAQLQPRKVALHLHAAPRLNLDAHGQPLALLVRVYTLRGSGAFAQAPYAAFLSPEAEREALGADLVDAREVMLVPGQHVDLDESLAREAGYLGVVALFHSPARQGWRVAFGAPEAEKAGVTLGLHACALSVGQGAPASGAAPPPLALVRCQ
jgi:type VI secretion system protein VasD